MATSECIDLQSEGDDEAAQKPSRAPDKVTACISLLSSEEDSPHKLIRHKSPAERNEAKSGQKETHELPSLTRREEVTQEGRKLRPARKLKRVFSEDYEVDLPGSPSLAAGCHTPKRARPSTKGEASCLHTPISEGAPIPEEDDTPKPVRKRGSRLTAEEKEARIAEKERQKQERLEAREAKKRERETEKAAKRAQREVEKLERQRETAARAAGSEEDAAVGKTALVDMTLHLDPDLAKHKIGRAIMQKLEDTFGQPGLEGPGIELGQRLPLSPFRSATWSRTVHPPSSGGLLSQSSMSQGASQGPAADRQAVPYTLVCFMADEFVEHIAEDQLQSLIAQAARNCPGCTLGVLVEGLESYLKQRERKDFKAKGPGGGGFNRAFVDEFVGSLACRWPGVRQVTVHDSAQAGEYVAGLTRALAEQPFRVEAAYVSSFGAGKPDSQSMLDLLRRAPLPHKEREIWFRALACIPDVGPQAAHALVRKS